MLMRLYRWLVAKGVVCALIGHVPQVKTTGVYIDDRDFLECERCRRVLRWS